LYLEFTAIAANMHTQEDLSTPLPCCPLRYQTCGNGVDSNGVDRT